MASRLKTARDQIATDWQALVPPTIPRRVYKLLTGRDILDGASGHRTFYFVAPTVAVISEFSTDFSVYRYEFDARMRMSTAGTGLEATFDSIVDESIQLIDAVNNRPIWPAGVVSVSSEGYEVQETDSEDFDIVFPLIAEIEEG